MAGRWPANLILTAPILDGGWEGVIGGGAQRASDGKDWSDGPVHGTGSGVTDFMGQKPTGQHYGDSGTYSRFFMLPPDPDPYDEYIRVMSCEPGCRVELRDG
jgi:hypothetical protein